MVKNRIPIYIMTYERPKYFKRSTESLLKTNIDITPIIFDDGSKDKNKENILISYDNPDYSVIKNTTTVGTKQQLLNIWRHWWENYSEIFDYCIHTQDDVIYNPQWLEELLKVYKTIPNLGILTPFDVKGTIDGGGYGWNNRDSTPYYEFSVPVEIGIPTISYKCRIGGVCWLTSKSFIEKMLSISEKTLASCGEDSYFSQKAKENGFTVAATNPSWVDHIGTKSIIHPNHREELCVKAVNFVGEE